MTLTLAHSQPEAEPITAPHNLDAEQALLGAVLYDNAVFHRVADWLKVEHFYDPVHGRIFDAAARQINAGSVCDAVTLKSRFEKDDGLADIGGTEYISELVAGACFGNAAVEYAKIVFELSRRRELMQIGRELVDASSDDADLNPIELVEATERRLAELTGTEEGEACFTAGEALRAALGAPVEFIETGLAGFDDLRAIAPGLTIIGGRSSMGKSALLCDLVLRSAQRGRSALMLSNEMNARQIASRWAATLTGVPYFHIMNGTMHRDQADRVAEVLPEIDRLPVTIIECPGVNIAGIRSRIRRWKRDQERAGNKIGVIGLDYLQNIGGAGGSIYERTSDIALGLQTIQLTFDVPLVVACQLSRAAEHEKDKRPSIRHLRDSGKIEEVADKIILVYRDAYYAEREPEESDTSKEMERRERASSRLVEADVAKNRQGALGKVKLMGDMACNRFEDWGA